MVVTWWIVALLCSEPLHQAQNNLCSPCFQDVSVANNWSHAGPRDKIPGKTNSKDTPSYSCHLLNSSAGHIHSGTCWCGF